MTNEEMQRAMQFILEQQAHFAASQQRHEENQQRFEENQQRFEENQRRFEENQRRFEENQWKHEGYLLRHDEYMLRHEEHIISHEENFRELEVAQLQTSQAVAHLSNVMLEIAEAQTRMETRVDVLTGKVEIIADKLAETDDRLNSLITVVERYVSGGRNGKS
ncbi:MAG TPA: hypothetical protein VM934_11030 [Pyrinomonadaceae bacterium]|jgi:hypothetical protein|nr:hypothetical protein [Pyrinomonadaceae bacterium]